MDEVSTNPRGSRRLSAVTPTETSSDDHAICSVQAWCDLPDGHGSSDHMCDADLPPVTATACRADFEVQDGGVLVPTVLTRLWADDRPSVVMASTYITLLARKAEHEVELYLTPDEADLLQRHLAQLLRELDR